MHRLARIGTLAACTLVGACAGGSSAPPATTRPIAQAHWVRAWEAPPQFAYPHGYEFGYATAPALTAGTLALQTVRTRITLTANSTAIRVTFTNAAGTSPLQIVATNVAAAAASPSAAIESQVTPLTFNGSSGATIAPGADIQSDPAPMIVARGQVIAVSMAVGAPVTTLTWHADGEQSAYVSLPGSGDHTRDLSGASYTTHIASRLFLRAVDVQGASTQTIVTFGDSQTDGRYSGIDADARWPDALARRLGAASLPFAVANAGISGNMLASTACPSGISNVAGGPAGVDRFAQDALGVPNLRTVIVLEGINDIGGCGSTASTIIAALQSVISQTHLAGARVIGATILPAGGDTSNNYSTPMGEATRTTVNAFIRSGAFDAVADFDAAVRDPADPKRLAPAYDSGDHLHPNAAGYARMASAVDLNSL